MINSPKGRARAGRCVWLPLSWTLRTGWSLLECPQGGAGERPGGAGEPGPNPYPSLAPPSIPLANGQTE